MNLGSTLFIYLKYPSANDSSACAIEDPADNSVVVIGGRDDSGSGKASSRVTKYRRKLVDGILLDSEF